MRKFLVALGISTAALTMAAPATAAEFFLDLESPFDSRFFGNSSKSSGDIFDTFWFDVPAGSVSGFLGSIKLSSALDVTLSSVKFDGTLINQEKTGDEELWSFGETPIGTGKHSIEVAGTWGSRGGSYAGTINYAGSGAVPEPASWAMMIAGFGAVGIALRSRRKPATA